MGLGGKQFSLIFEIIALGRGLQVKFHLPHLLRQHNMNESYEVPLRAKYLFSNSY